MTFPLYSSNITCNSYSSCDGVRSSDHTPGKGVYFIHYTIHEMTLTWYMSPVVMGALTLQIKRDGFFPHPDQDCYSLIPSLPAFKYTLTSEGDITTHESRAWHQLEGKVRTTSFYLPHKASHNLYLLLLLLLLLSLSIYNLRCL